MKNLRKLAGLLACVAVLAGCGGGGGGEGTPAPRMAGLYSGTTTAPAGTFQALILGNGRVYGVVGTAVAINTVFFGTGPVTASGFTSSAGSNLSTSSGVTTTGATMTLTGVPKTSIEGSISDSTGTTHFTATYRAIFEEAASLASVAGTYSGQFGGLGPGDGFLLQLVVGANGAFSGTTDSRCPHAGTLTPNAAGVNVYDVTITFGSGCRKQGTLAGHARWEAASDPRPATLTIFASSSDFRDAWVFFGGRN